MKKLIAMLLVLVMVLSIAACAETGKTNDPQNEAQTPAGEQDTEKDPTGETEQDTEKDPAGETEQDTEKDPTGETEQDAEKEWTAEEINAKSEGVMTYAEYAAAELEAEVTVECYVQGHQSWWDNKITVYAEDLDGGYFLYELACSEEDAAKLVPGTKIKVSGYKAEWAGEVEIIDATFEFATDGITYIAEAQDVTELLGSEELIAKQNMYVSFKEMTFVKNEFKNDGGDDIYVTLEKDGTEYAFCVELYLTGTDTDVYKAVSALEAGDKINVEGFLYWYEGMNPHITAVKVPDEGKTAMTHAEYVAAELESEVTVECYVQGAQSWWEDKITVYAQDADGGYFLYELACSEEDAAKLVPGTKILVNGYKAEWAGEVEIIDATFEFVEADPYVAEALDVTELLGSEELIEKQNMFVSFSEMTFVKNEFKNDGGDDIYVTLEKDGTEYAFCVELYLTGTDTDVYKAVSELQAGDKVNVEGFLYWYEGMNPHITAIEKI